jgi:diadenosine tetraphosphate (Ap4A) HIT family hydrolase
MMTLRDNECEVCEELSGAQPPWLRGESRILLRNEAFSLTPTLGSIVPGYFLVWANDHVHSMANLDASDSEALQEFLRPVAEHIHTAYNAPAAIFEHGVDGSTPVGSCIDHAHLHVFPCAPTLSARVHSLRTDWDEIDWASLNTLSSAPYLLFAPPNSNIPLVSRIGDRVESQLVRKAIAVEHGCEDEWDWAVFPFLDNLRATSIRWRSEMGV